MLAFLDQLLLRVGELENQVADLRARAPQNSTNSSRPPSSDLPGSRRPGSHRR